MNESETVAVAAVIFSTLAHEEIRDPSVPERVGAGTACFGVAHDPSFANPCDEHEDDDYGEKLSEKRRGVSIFCGEDSIQHTELSCEAPGEGHDQKSQGQKRGEKQQP